MRSLLCGLLSIVLFVNSITPAYADILPVGRTVARTGEEVTRRLPTLLRNVGEFAGQSAATKDLVNQLLRRAESIQNALPNVVRYQQWFEQSNLARFAVDGEYQGVAQQILSLTPKEQESLLRNEFVLLTLLQQVSTEQLLSARNLLRADLLKKQTAFKAFSETPLEQIIQTQSAEAKACQEALSSAAALALVGGPQDAEALISFYNAAAGTAFEQVATRLVGRGLLRLGAYKEFSQWSRKVPQQGEFWLGLSAYARQNKLPVFIRPDMTKSVAAEPEGLIAWLEKGNLANGLNANSSLVATKQWMSIGVKQPAVEKSVPQAAPKSTSVAEPVATTQGAEQPVLPDLTQASLLSTGTEPIASVTLPKTEGAAAQVSQPEVTGVVTNPADVPAAVTEEVKDTSLTLYSGLPLMKILDAVEDAVNYLRRLWGLEKEVGSSALAEEPDLHDNTVRPIYEDVATPADVDADDVLAAAVADDSELEIAESGFKLTRINEEGVEQILRNVGLTIWPTFKTEGYNRVVLREDNIFELRNMVLKPGKMSHFFFALSNQYGEFYRLAQAISRQPLYRPMRVKLERKPNTRYTPISLDLVDFETGAPLNIQASVDKTLLPSNATDGRLLLDKEGKVYFKAGDEPAVPLDGYYIRLPKEESPVWMKALSEETDTFFNLGIFPTDDKVNFMTYLVPLERIGLGKAFGPIMEAFGFSPFFSTAIPLFANNGLPLLMGPLMPYFRRSGDANMYRFGLGAFAAAYVGAVLMGFNGFSGVLSGGEVSPFVRAAFVGVLMTAGAGTVLVNTPQNNLILQNTGIIQEAREKAKKWQSDPNVERTISYLAKRIKEIFASGNVEMRESVLCQLPSAMKNLGTFAFLALPFLFNELAKAMGLSLQADFSISFIPLAGLSIYVFYKAIKMALKDSVPRDTAVLHKTLLETEHAAEPLIRQQMNKLDNWDFSAIAKELNSAIKPYARGLAYKFKRKAPEVAVEIEQQSLNRLKANLIKAGVDENKAQKALDCLKDALDKLGHRDTSIWDVLKMQGVASTMLAMTLLTVHELGGSSEVAFLFNALAKEKFGIENDGMVSALGLFFTAFALYGSSFFSRLAGNWLALRMSEGSMYAFSSAMSVLGTGLLIAANDSLPLMFTGAMMATFGMGNFYSQIFTFARKLAPSNVQEIAILAGYTMPLAAGLSACVHVLTKWGATQGIEDLGLMATLGALVVSFLVCPKIFSGSSLVLAAQYYGRRALNGIRSLFGLPPSSGTNGAANGGAGAAAGAH